LNEKQLNSTIEIIEVECEKAHSTFSFFIREFLKTK